LKGLKVKTVIFGGTGFIGSHVTEQLVLAGHDVTAVVRHGSNTNFLSSLNLDIKEISFDNSRNISKVIEGAEVVYNCTARPHPNLTMEEHREVEVYLTRTLAEASADAGAKRFVQLSTIQAHGSRTAGAPIVETSPLDPSTPFQRAYVEREEVVNEVGAQKGIETVIYRPASTIGVRDLASFFSRLYMGYREGKFPLARGADKYTKVSLIDTRDVGRAMEWLGGLSSAAGETYLGKGYDIRWVDIKNLFDKLLERVEQKELPPKFMLYIIATVSEWLVRPPKIPPLMRFMVLALTNDLVIDDSKIRKTGFEPKYGFMESAKTALADIQAHENQLS
jgi:nucleoside-diphosphate-sugar epimerase